MTEFMSQEVNAKLVTLNDIDVLQLPYDDGSTNMIILLPKKGKSMTGVMTFLKNNEVGRLKNITETKVQVSLPKFKIEFTAQLKTQLMGLGIKDLFTRKADLRNISNRQLHVSNAVHKAFIEVDEKGTEAAAATGIVISTRSQKDHNKNFFKADRPFMFMIYDSRNQIPLFTGKVSFLNPSRSCGQKF